MSTSNKATIGRLHMSAIFMPAGFAQTDQIDTGAEAALGLMISYLGAAGSKIPHSDVAILRNAC